MRAAARIIIAARKREAQILLVTDETISSFSQNTNNQITVDRKENEISKDPLPQDEASLHSLTQIIHVIISLFRHQK